MCCCIPAIFVSTLQAPYQVGLDILKRFFLMDIPSPYLAIHQLVQRCLGLLHGGIDLLLIRPLQLHAQKAFTSLLL